MLRNLLPQENKALAAAKESNNENKTEFKAEAKTKEEVHVKPEEKFVCNLQNTSTQAKGFDVSFKKQ